MEAKESILRELMIALVDVKDVKEVLTEAVLMKMYGDKGYKHCIAMEEGALLRGYVLAHETDEIENSFFINLIYKEDMIDEIELKCKSEYHILKHDGDGFVTIRYKYFLKEGDNTDIYMKDDMYITEDKKYCYSYNRCVNSKDEVIINARDILAALDNINKVENDTPYMGEVKMFRRTDNVNEKGEYVYEVKAEFIPIRNELKLYNVIDEKFVQILSVYLKEADNFEIPEVFSDIREQYFGYGKDDNSKAIVITNKSNMYYSGSGVSIEEFLNKPSSQKLLFQFGQETKPSMHLEFKEDAEGKVSIHVDSDYIAESFPEDIKIRNGKIMATLFELVINNSDKTYNELHTICAEYLNSNNYQVIFKSLDLILHAVLKDSVSFEPVNYLDGVDGMRKFIIQAVNEYKI